LHCRKEYVSLGSSKGHVCVPSSLVGFLDVGPSSLNAPGRGGGQAARGAGISKSPQ